MFILYLKRTRRLQPIVVWVRAEHDFARQEGDLPSGRLELQACRTSDSSQRKPALAVGMQWRCLKENLAGAGMMGEAPSELANL